jgi:hypothetical protein
MKIDHKSHLSAHDDTDAELDLKSLMQQHAACDS